jgi:hypothetical protein
MEEPIWTKSKTDKDEPMRVRPYMEIEDPILTKDRREIAEPM